MHRIASFILGLALLTFHPAEASDPEAPTSQQMGLGVSGSTSLYSDYIFRGITQTNGEPAIQGSVELNHPMGLYAGFFGSNVYFPGYATHLELDFYMGYRHLLARELTFSLGVIRYNYSLSPTLNTWEIPLKFNWGALVFGYDFSPNWNSSGGAAGYISAQYALELPLEIRLLAGAGYSHFDETAANAGFRSYFDCRLEMSRQVSGITLGLSGSAVSRKQTSDELDPRAAFSISKSF